MSGLRNIKINPVKAVCQKYKDTLCGIQGINDTCFGICTAFSQTYDSDQIDPQCAKACEDLVRQKKIAEFGVGDCDHQVPYRPVSWGQIPRFVPQLLSQGESPEVARDKCKNMCYKYVPNLASECVENCILDYSAIESFPDAVNNPMVPEKINKIESTLKKDEKNHPIIFWGTIGGIFLIILLVICILAFRK